MRKFIEKHAKLYWLIVAFVAVFVFTLVTFIGLGKLHSANASVEYSSIVIDGNTLPDIRTVDWSNYAEYFETEYGYTGNIGEKIIREHKYMVVVINPYFWPDSVPYVSYLFTNEPLQYQTNKNYWLPADWHTSVAIEVRNGAVEMMRGYGQNNWDGTTLGFGPDLIPFVVSSGNMSSQTIASTYDMRNGLLSVHNSYQIVTYPKAEPDIYYSVDAPYINFRSVDFVNKLAEGGSSTLFTTLYDKYTKDSYWAYNGHLNNIGEDDDGYVLEAEFLVHVPTSEYILGQYEKYDIDIGWEHNVLKNDDALVKEWYNDNSAEYYEVKVLYNIPIVPDSNGNFTYMLAFDFIENLVKYYDEDLRSKLNECSEDFRAVWMSYLHVECMTGSVRTIRGNAEYYGRVCTNQFDRGIFDACIEVIPDVDINNATPEEIDKVIQDALKDAQDKYVEDLEQRVNELESELENLSGSLGTFDADFDGNGFWGAIKGIGSGILGLGGFLGDVAGVMGGLFGFLPYDMQQIIGYFFIVTLVVAVWKLIKG